MRDDKIFHCYLYETEMQIKIACFIINNDITYHYEYNVIIADKNIELPRIELTFIVYTKVCFSAF